MKFCYNTNFPLPKQSQRSRSVLQDGSRSLVLFWKEITPSYNRRNTVGHLCRKNCTANCKMQGAKLGYMAAQPDQKICVRMTVF